MDDNFVKDYLQLNDYHKTILGYIAKDLLELQKKFSEDEINRKASAAIMSDAKKYYNRKDVII